MPKTKNVTKPNLSFWQIWNMCFGFMGIQFGFALQNSNVSRIFQTLGASMDEIPILWIAAPVTGLLVQPIVGYMSDRTWNRLGRRRPYFLYGALLASAALLLMPNSPTLWIAAGMLWIIDASINISMEPFRAFVGDMLPQKQRPTGFAMQSFFIGVGAIVASALPWMMTNWMDISNTAPPGQVPDSVTYSFYFGAAVLLLAVLWTIVSTKEYSPSQLAAFESKSPAQPESQTTLSDTGLNAQKYKKAGMLWLGFGAISWLLLTYFELEKELYIMAGGIIAFGLIQLATSQLKQRGSNDNALCAIVDDLYQMPTVMKQLARVQFFSWFAFFAMWIYTTPAVTTFHYGTTDTASALFNEGANWVGVLFAAFNGFAALAAIIIPWLANRTGYQKAHLINLWLGGLGLISFVVIKDPAWLLLSMVGVGFAWASILSMPYVMLSTALPANKMGVYMGIFNFFIVIPQILAASVLGFLLNHFLGGNTIYALVLGGLSLLIAGVLSLLVHDQDN